MLDYLDFVRRSLALVDTEIHTIEEAILNGFADHAATRYAIGKRHGLMQARSVIVKCLTPEDRRDLRILDDRA